MACRIGPARLLYACPFARLLLLSSLDIIHHFFFFGLCMSSVCLPVSFACTLDRCTVFYHARFRSLVATHTRFGFPLPLQPATQFTTRYLYVCVKNVQSL
ncbi:hypothetical protein F5J12DRAFT_312926 [Pisolithus orientalis]|uniref:uncharacterized protein n=1 Tax=Pisolithus orientalis TaxID=936130 RepID=UPI00222549BB|nr:uncharacterized protein F5J12DRAFT_312926 [Pisolithus orientalis]KAI6030865.1 hypothetical protein F5J12DRAFT_312926 [Pisolithus orientalis]